MKLLLKNKLRSGALQFTLFVSVVIALLLAAVIMLAYTHGFFIEQSKAIVENVQLADTGMAALANERTISVDTITLPLENSREEQTVRIHLSHWGIFEKAFVETTHRKKKFVKCSLMGSVAIAVKRPALYLKEASLPLAVAGNTQIRGNAFLPQQGIRPGNIAGNSYYGTELVYGNIEKSEPQLPKLRYNYKEQLNYYLQEYQPASSENTIPISNHGKIVNSFNGPVKGYFSNEIIVLENVSIYGNIIIRSSQKIIVRNTANLKNIILAAPVIEVEGGCKGNFQAIAETTIKIGKNCSLSYPTALVLAEKENKSVAPVNNEFDNKIFIDKSSSISGSVCYFINPTRPPDFKVNIFIGLQSAIKGEIYCEGSLELKGKVLGTVYTGQFLANENGSIFVNHLYNSIIDSSKLPEAFGGVLFETGSKSVIKWLY